MRLAIYADSLLKTRPTQAFAFLAFLGFVASAAAAVFFLSSAIVSGMGNVSFSILLFLQVRRPLDCTVLPIYLQISVFEDR